VINFLEGILISALGSGAIEDGKGKKERDGH
jgi:hypothetical protein